MTGKYRYDRKSNTFKQVTRSVHNIVFSILKYTIAVATLTTVFYTVFALLVSTDEEKALRQENRLYRELYGELEEREKLVSGVVDGLTVKDNDIYGTLFAADAPPVDPFAAGNQALRVDSLSGKYSLVRRTDRVEDNFREVMRILESWKRTDLPPLSLPLQDMDYAQTGASVGKRINPFFRVEMEHSGIDLIARQGEPVYAAADGRVVDVFRGKGRGNVVIVDHGNGYETHYGFVTGVTVSRGQTVKRGKKLGAVGISRGSYAPHLHFEVFKDGKAVDPVDYFFASVSPEEYTRMLYYSASTMQSMD